MSHFFEDFPNAMEMDKNDPNKDKELYQAFKIFDSDGDGFVTFEEFTRAMKVCLIFDCAILT